MYHFTNYYRLALLVVGLATVGVCVSGKSLAGEPPDKPKADREEAAPAAEKSKGTATVDYWGEMHGIWGGAHSQKFMGKRAPEKPWGNLRVRFVIDDPNAKREAAITGHADPQQAAGDETLAIDPVSHGIRNVVVVVRHVSRAHEMYAHESEKPVVLTQHDNRFAPHVLPVMIGQDLRIENRDASRQVAVIHPLRGHAGDLVQMPGDEATWRFIHAQSRPVPVTCTFNPSMRAYVVVANNPYVGVSDEQGVVALTNVPAGEELDLRIWHERSGWLVLFTGDFRVTVPADGLLELREIYIPAADLASPNGFDRAKPVAY